jgi:CubicO group peptidase (beta-lactamase class C family)
MGYDVSNPLLTKWRLSTGRQPGEDKLDIIEKINMPVTFEPGSSWLYGMSLDMAGLLIARLNSMTLEEYFDKYVWAPLGIRDMTFHVQLKPEVEKKLVAVSGRLGIENPNAIPKDTGEKVDWRNEPWLTHDLPIGTDYGGHGLRGSAVEYMKVLHSVCQNDGKLLKPATLDSIFQPQLTGEPLEAINNFLGPGSLQTGTFSSVVEGTKLNHGLGAMLIQTDQPTGPKAGTLTWFGLPNLQWSIDRESGLTLFYASSLLPFGDYSSYRFQKLFENEMYARYAEFTNK